MGLRSASEDESAISTTGWSHKELLSFILNAFRYMGQVLIDIRDAFQFQNLSYVDCSKRLIDFFKELCDSLAASKHLLNSISIECIVCFRG